MAFDKTGKHHMNPHHAKMADGVKMLPKPPLEVETPEDEMQPEHTTLHDHGDGTFHTEGHGGETEDHPTIHHALSHMAQKHGHDGLAEHIMAHEGMGEAPMGQPAHKSDPAMAGY